MPCLLLQVFRTNVDSALCVGRSNGGPNQLAGRIRVQDALQGKALGQVRGAEESRASAVCKSLYGEPKRGHGPGQEALGAGEEIQRSRAPAIAGQEGIR